MRSPMDARLAELLQRHEDNSLDATQQVELNTMLRDDPTARDAFVTYWGVTQLLGSLLDVDATDEELVVPVADAGKISKPIVAPFPHSFPRYALAVLAASLLVAVGAWQLWFANAPALIVNNPDNHGSADVQLVNWRITPTGDADYQILTPTRVQLTRGELLVESTNSPDQADPSELVIETPAGEVTAQDTQFFVGHHRPILESSPKGTPMRLLPITRIFVLAGIATLSNACGTVQAQEQELATAVVDSEPTKTAVQSNSEFAVNLYQQLAEENTGQNLFFSPYSVSTALAMTAEGARGETAQQMGDVLCFPKDLQRVGADAQLIPWRTSTIHVGLAALSDRFNQADDSDEIQTIRTRIETLRGELAQASQDRQTLASSANQNADETGAAIKKEKKIADELSQELSKVDQYEIRLANALWGEQSYPFKKEYSDTLNEHYKTGGIFPVDFVGNFNQVREDINAWTETETNDRIKDLLPKGSLDTLTRLVLVNAIYFKGDWANPFEANQTKDRDFTLADGSKVSRPIMQGRQSAGYAAFESNGGFKMLELPYKGEELSMVVIAPNDPKGLAELETAMDLESLTQWIGELKNQKVMVSLPKFKLETGYTLGDSEAPGTLQHMGMVRAFRINTAQFDGMSESTSAEKLYISKVFHKAFVEVNEVGTEAAAATAVVMGSRSAPNYQNFNADRPFIYLIRDRVSGSVLFMGRIMDPAGDQQ